MRKHFIIIFLLFLSANALAKNVYKPTTKVLYLDEVTSRNILYKNVAVKLHGFKVRSIGSYTFVHGGLLDSPEVPVNFVNNQPVTVYVSFTIDDLTQSPGIIVLPSQTGCGTVSVGANASSFSIAPQTTCSATVDPTQFIPSPGSPTGSTRFCATTTSAPANCMNAQSQNLTMIETTFLSFSSGSCYNNASCVYYDISVIPAYCQNLQWYGTDWEPPLTAQNPLPPQSQWPLCANTGGASYNLPVQMSCANQPTYTCQGPTNGTWGNSNYPSNCGNPAATCATGGSPGCNNGISAYYFPTPPLSPNAVCPNGNPLTITFLAGS